MLRITMVLSLMAIVGSLSGCVPTVAGAIASDAEREGLNTLARAPLPTSGFVTRVIMSCPDSYAMKQCMDQYDKDKDGQLNRDEFEDFYGELGWWRRRYLSDEDVYWKNCDLNHDGKVSGMEVLSSICMPTCEEQSVFFNGICT